MVNSPFKFCAHPGDFRLKAHDPLVQFLDREGIEILPGDENQQIAGAFRKDIVQIHDTQTSPINHPCQYEDSSGHRKRIGDTARMSDSD
jgi:hypothetical protein